MDFSDDPIQSNLDGNNNPLHNLSTIRSKIDTVIRFLSDSINQNTRLTHRQLNTVSSEISTAIHQSIVNASTLIASTRPEPDPESEIVELDAVELLAEHIHFCEICGKGFKRDANLRMHMRAHGNQFKTPEALAKPVAALNNGMSEKQRRFSCPYEGCYRNKKHKKFRALKSVICVKNHFKRSHCPKMYSCNRCNKKRFSVVADLKSHLKHCGEAAKWRCSCGTRFSRKDKLFGHVALFEGHMPAVVDDDNHGGKGKAVAVAPAMDLCDVSKGLKLNDGYFESFLDDGFGSIENRCLRDVLGISNNLESDNWEFCNF